MVRPRRRWIAWRSAGVPFTDPHTPGEERTDEVHNKALWYKAFGVKPGEALYLPPEQRVDVW